MIRTERPRGLPSGDVVLPTERNAAERRFERRHSLRDHLGEKQEEASVGLDHTCRDQRSAQRAGCDHGAAAINRSAAEYAPRDRVVRIVLEDEDAAARSGDADELAGMPDVIIRRNVMV